LLAGLTLLLTQQLWLWRWDQAVYDAHFKFWSRPPPDDVLIVAIDAASLSAQGSWPWPRQTHAQLVNILTEAGARAIVFDVIFSEPSQNNAAGDNDLVSAVHTSHRVILPVLAEQLQSNGQLLETLPFVPLAENAAALGHIHVELDSDGIARSTYLMEGLGSPRWPALSLAALRFLDAQSWTKLPGLRHPDIARVSQHNWIRDYHVWIPFAGPPGLFPRISYAQVLQKKFFSDTFRNKIVFVGSTVSGLGDAFPTPVSGLNQFMPGVEVHANLFSAIRDQRLIRPISQPWQLGISFFFVLLPALLFPHFSPRSSLICAGLLIAADFFLSTVLLRGFLIWFQPMATAISLSLSYPFWSWRRLEYTMHYLNQELERLHAETTTLASTTVSDFTSTMRLIQHILPIDGWMLVDGFNNIQQKSGVAPKLPSQRQRLSPTAWHCQHQELWIIAEQYGGQGKLGMHWAGSEKPNSYQLALLKELITQPEPATSSKLRGTVEVIQARIQQVQEATERLRAMRRLITDSLAEMADGVLIVSFYGQILVANHQAAAYLYGQSNVNLAGAALIDVLEKLEVSNDETLKNALSRVIFEGITTTCYARTHFGRDIFIQLAPLALGEGHERGLIVNLTDITELQENKRRRSELLGFLSHDLRSPLVSILALLELAKEHKRQGKPEGELLIRIENYISQLLEFSDNFLNLTKAESPEEIPFIDVDLIHIAHNAMEQVWPQANHKNITITPKFDTDEAWLLGDSQLLERAIVNLLANAIKYSPTESGIELHVGQNQKGHFCCVSDHGIGISEDYLPHIFDRFSREKIALASGIPGTGLGLAFVKAVATKHHGSVEVKSTLGNGSCFCLKLPAFYSLPD
jgi:CHASE2 domain-containing sensor protein/signal transduction histidine kinase